MRKYSNRLLIVLIIVSTLSITLAVTGCSRGNLADHYGRLFSPGPGLSYRSYFFEVDPPTVEPYPVKVNNKYGYTHNTQGAHAEMVIEPIFTSAKLFTEGLGAVEVDGKWGYIEIADPDSQTFNFVIPLAFSGAEPFSEGLAAVKVDDRYGYIDANGSFVIEPQYLEAHYFSGGLATVSAESGWFFIDQAGRVMIPGPFEGAESFYGELAPVKIDGLWGFIDKLGQTVIPAIYEDAWSFDFRSMAAVKKNGNWMMIDKSGDKVWFPDLGG